MKRKILFMSPFLAVGGVERVLVNLLKKLDYDKYDVSLCLYTNFGFYFDEIPLQVSVFSIFNSRFFSRVFIYIKRKFNINFPLKLIVRNKIIKHYNVGVCFSDGILTDIMLFAKDRVDNKISWVHSCYKSQIDLKNVYTSNYIKMLLKNRYSQLNNLVFVSTNSRKEFEELFGHPTKMHTIYNLFDYEEVIKKGNEQITQNQDDEIIKIVAIGRLAKVKEYSRLLSAAKILSQKKLKFKILIVGDGILKNELLSLRDSFSLKDQVDFLGLKLNPYPYLKNSNILALTSSSEAFPTVLIEAMILGVPIVATKCSGCVEITENGKYGLLSEHSAEDIADKIEQMITNPQLRQYYAELAKERMVFFNEKETLNKIYTLLDK